MQKYKNVLDSVKLTQQKTSVFINILIPISDTELLYLSLVEKTFVVFTWKLEIN